MSYITLTGLILLVIAAPTAVGSVYIITYSAMELLLFSLLIYHLWTNDFSLLEARVAGFVSPHASSSFGLTLAPRRPSYVGRTLLIMSPMLFFLLFCLVQLLPLPFSSLEKLSPHTAALYTRLGLSPISAYLAHRFLPLTVSLSATSTAILKWSAYTVIFFLAATVVSPSSDDGWITWLFAAVFVIGFAEAVYGLYLYLNQSEYLLWFRRSYRQSGAAGTYINCNHFVGLLNMCIPISVALFATRTGTLKASYSRRARADTMARATSPKALLMYLLFLGVIIMVLANIFSLSRMGQFSLVIALLLFALPYSLSVTKGQLQTAYLPLSLLVVLGLGLLWGGWKGLDPVEDRWQTLNVSYKDRLLIWSSTAELIRDFPLTGTGLGTYKFAYAPYKPQKYDAYIVDHAHDDYLELLSEVGVIGFLPWVSFYLLFLICTLRVWFRRRNHVSRFLGAGGLVAATAMLVHSLADFNLQIPANAMLLFLIMGLTWRVVNTSTACAKA